MGAGVWFTLIERPSRAATPHLSLRVGLGVAAALDDLARELVRLKWPNDLYLRAGKVSGILVESRWRDDRVDWMAVGVGINIARPSAVPGAAALPAGVSRVAVLERVIPAVRAAAAAQGLLDADELNAYATRDLARGRACRAPVAGRVRGIAPDGALIVSTAHGDQLCRAGSLVFQEDT